VHVSCAGQWPRVRFDDLLREHAGIDCSTATLDGVRTMAVKWGMKTDEASAMGRGNLLDFIFKKSARNRIINPTFVTHYPGDLKPLAQQHSDGTAASSPTHYCGLRNNQPVC
jgi:lysyl-tRNA synthetase class 2